MQPTEPDAIEIGDIVAIDCVDWSIYSEQHARVQPYSVVKAIVYGEVIARTDDGEGVVIAPQVFRDGDLRFTLVVPVVTIKRCFVLAKRGELDEENTNAKNI